MAHVAQNAELVEDQAALRVVQLRPAAKAAGKRLLLVVLLLWTLLSLLSLLLSLSLL